MVASRSVVRAVYLFFSLSRFAWAEDVLPQKFGAQVRGAFEEIDADRPA